MIAVDIPLSKTVSIAFTSLKAELFGIIAILTADQITSKPYYFKCNVNNNSFITIIRALFMVSFVADLMALGYFSCTKRFNRVVYYVFYIYHWIMSLFCIIGGVVNFFTLHQCIVMEHVITTFFALNVILQLNIIVVMMGEFYLVLKYVHFGCNLTWSVL